MSIGPSISSSISPSIGEDGLPYSAIAHFDELSITGSNPVTAWINRAKGGAAFDLDTVVGTAANLTTLPTGVAVGPGAAADHISTPDIAAYGITDLDVRFRIAPFDWTYVTQHGLAGQDGDVANRGWAVRLQGDGKILLVFWPTGASASEVAKSSTAAVSLDDNEVQWVRVTMDVDNGSSGYDIDFYTSSENVEDADDVITWTPLGDTVTTATATTIFHSTSALKFGSGIVNAISLDGKLYRGALYDGIDGTKVADCDPSQAAVNSSTFTSGGVVWTINGDMFVNATGHTGIYSRGSVGLETTAGQTISSPVTVFAVFKPTLAAPGAGQFIFDSKSGAGTAQFLQTVDANDDKYAYNQGTNISISQAYDANLRVFTAQGNGDATSKLTVSDVGSVTGDTGPEDWNFGSVLMDLSGANTMQGLFLEFIVYDRALNESEITAAQAFLEGKYGT